MHKSIVFLKSFKAGGQPEKRAPRGSKYWRKLLQNPECRSNSDVRTARLLLRFLPRLPQMCFLCLHFSFLLLRTRLPHFPNAQETQPRAGFIVFDFQKRKAISWKFDDESRIAVRFRHCTILSMENKFLAERNFYRFILIGLPMALEIDRKLSLIKRHKKRTVAGYVAIEGLQDCINPLVNPRTLDFRMNLPYFPAQRVTRHNTSPLQKMEP